MLYLVSMDLKKYIVDVPNFPSKGVVFRDITPLLKDAKAFNDAVSKMTRPFMKKGIQAVVGIESRGFILGSPIALRLKASFIPIRKKGKLPRAVIRGELVKEYGMDVIEMHKDAVKKGSRVLIVDDVLATGGTLESAVKMLKKVGAKIVGVSLLINLTYLPGKERLKKLLPSTTALSHVLEY